MQSGFLSAFKLILENIFQGNINVKFGNKTYLLSSTAVPPATVGAGCWSLGRVATWAKHILCVSQQELTASVVAGGQQGLLPVATSDSAVLKGAVNQARPFPVL